MVNSQSSLDSLTKVYIDQAVKKEIESQNNQIYWWLGISAGGLSVLGIYLGVYKIKKSAEKAVEEKVASLVNKEIAEKVGVKAEILREYFKNIERKQKT